MLSRTFGGSANGRRGAPPPDQRSGATGTRPRPGQRQPWTSPSHR